MRLTDEVVKSVKREIMRRTRYTLHNIQGGDQDEVAIQLVWVGLPVHRSAKKKDRVEEPAKSMPPCHQPT